MTREYYLKSFNAYTDAINERLDLIEDLKRQYIADNTKDFAIGDKVRVIRNGFSGGAKEGFLVGWEVKYSGIIVPKLHKIKKDGTEANCNVCVYVAKDDEVKIEKI